MKKSIFFFLAIVFLNSCSARKKSDDSTFMKGFFTYYNTLFNSKDALETELRNRDQAHKDNFYAPYISLLTYEDAAAEADLQQDDFTGPGRNSGPGSPSGGNRYQSNSGGQNGATILEISEAKALKAISKYSVMKGGEEKNKKIFDAYILLTRARIYRDKPLEALDGLNYVFNNMRKDKRLPLAKIYQGLAYSKLNDYYRAEQVFADLKKNDLKKDYRKLFSVYYSEMLLNAGRKQDAVEALSDAFALNKDRKLRSRIAFLRGQVLSNLDRNEEARESFVTAYKNANNFEFEVKSQIEIAKTFNGKDDEFAGAKDYLEKISKKGTYASRKNEFYYALGLMADKAGRREDASEFFAQSLKEKVSDPQVRGLTYYEIGKAYLKDGDYLSAGAFYDSALTVMNYEPTKILLQEQSSNIKNLSANYYLIKRNDSVLALTKMPEAEKVAFFTKYIDGIKAKEQREAIAQNKAEKNRGFDTTDFALSNQFSTNSSGFQDFSSSKGGFYFANLSTVAKGESTFKQLWGNRILTDNWRTSIKSSSIEDLKNEAMGLATAPNPRRLEPSFYIEQIPTSSTEIETLKKARDTASLGLGRMYETYFSDTPLATKTLYNLIDNQPVEEVKLQALYQVFSMNYEKNPSAAERAKSIILNEFPYTSYAEFVKNPKNKVFSQSTEEVSKLYSQAFELYDQEKYEESKIVIQNAIAQFPKDELIPKFSLLNAFNTGKTSGKEIMILQLEQIALNYSKTAEGEKAREMLKYLKSDLDMQSTVDEGKVIEVSTPLRPNNSYTDDDPLPNESTEANIPPNAKPKKNTDNSVVR